MEPKALLAKAKQGRRGPEEVEHVLREYYSFLIDEKRNAKSSAAQWYALLRSFFTANGVNLGRFPAKIGVQSVYEKPKVPSQDSVREMVRSRDSPRDKFLIAFLAQTGQGIGVLTAMKRNMITKMASGHGMVKVPQTFPNTHGENVNELGLPYTFVIGRDTMRLLHDLPMCEGGWLIDISLRQMARIVDEAARATHVQKKEPTEIGRSWSTVHPNTFRKYWKDNMIKSGSDPRCFMHMMGNRVPSVLGNWEPTDDKLLEAYKKAESKLEVL